MEGSFRELDCTQKRAAHLSVLLRSQTPDSEASGQTQESEDFCITANCFTDFASLIGDRHRS
ncbi:hypothetical protein [Microcoleus sp.]|uniref:hypothetical protein n=1 Tax=Microcoleus sp. TaxID=44472 RepID=UPI003525133B